MEINNHNKKLLNLIMRGQVFCLYSLSHLACILRKGETVLIVHAKLLREIETTQGNRNIYDASQVKLNRIFNLAVF